MNNVQIVQIVVMVLVVLLLKAFIDFLENKTKNINKNSALKNMPYIRKESMTYSEKNFYRFLVNMDFVRNNYVVFSQINLDKLIGVPRGLENNPTYYNKINKKSVDFVLYDKKDLSPKLAIELDGTSHNISARRERDNFVDLVFEKVGIPLIHIERNDRGYVEREIEQKIRS